MDMTIGFIGGGNMATSLIGGLTADACDPTRIWVSDPAEDKLRELRERHGVHVTTDNARVAQQSQVLVLAVKPQVLKAVATALAPAIQSHRPLVISIAAGVREPDLTRWLGGDIPVVRAMPNTPALVLSGATALYANPMVTDGQRDMAEFILRAVGMTLWVSDEAAIDSVTALSGSGPAYFFLVMEAIEEAGIRLGLPPETARLLTLETAFGAAKMALASPDTTAMLRQKVTSPGGTTERALAVLEDGQLRALFADALAAAKRRSEELADLLGKA